MVIDRRQRQRIAVATGVVYFRDSKATQRGRKPVECVALKSGAEQLGGCQRELEGRLYRGGGASKAYMAEHRLLTRRLRRCRRLSQPSSYESRNDLAHGRYAMECALARILLNA